MEMQRDGTLMVKGDPAQLQERLRKGGVDRMLRRKGGVLIGLDQVDKARQLLGAPQPHPAQISEGADTAGSPPINALHASSVAFESPSATSVASSSDDAQRESRIQEQARILQGAPVAVLKGNEAPHGYPLLRDWAVRLFQGFGNKATNREIGQVVLDERSVRDLMAHRMNPYKAVAFAAARQVVEHGALVLSAQHSRDTTGHFISAPVSIAGVENIVTVLVRTTTNSQRMYLHSAITKESLLKSGNSGADTVDGVERSGKATSGDVASVLRRLLTVNVEVPVASISKPAPRNATSKFSTHSGNHAPGLSPEQVQELVQQALSGLRNPPPVDVVGRSEEAWIGAPEGVMGAALPEEGRIVIVASAHQNADAVAETLFHEMFHLGVRNVLPSRDYVQSMLDLAKRDRRVQQYAIEWKAKAPDAPHQLRVLRERGFTGTELTAQYEALAIEEGLAVVAEELRAQKLAGTRLGMRIRTLANWLASVADRMGMGLLAASIRAMSYNEAERFVMRAIDQAGAVGAETSHTGQTRFSTRSAQDPSAGLQTDDKNDGTQIHSMRMETQRDGTLMVRGDPTQLQERLRQGGVDRVLQRKGGVVVGLDQVHKARQLLQQPPSAPAWAGPSRPSRPSLPGQQFSRSAPDQASQARGLPSKPATVQSVRAAVAKLTNSMGLLAEGRGRVVVATSADIQAHWEPLIGEVDMGSQDIGLAQGFFDPSTDTVFLIADHIEAGQEIAVAAHELAHKHGKAVLGEAGWRHLHEVIGSWANRPEGSLERRVYDEAMARVQASRPDSAAPDTYSSEELFPYAVQVAMELGVQPTALMPANSVQGWLARVRAAMHGAWDRLTNKPELFDSQDLVDLAFAVAQRENPAYASKFDEPSAPVAPRPGITAQQAQDIVDKVLQGLDMRGTVTPVIVQNPTAAGLVAPESMPSGGVSEGRLYLFLEGIRDEVEGFRVVFHELFHLGLSQSVTLQEYRQTMLHLLADPLVRKYAARWKNSEDGHSRRSSMPINNWHALAVEEALADMAEEIHHERGGVGTREMADWVRRTIAWMADLAHHWGMPGVARRLRGMTLTQAEAFVVGAVLKARTGAPVLLPDARWASSRNGRDPVAAKAAYELMYRRGQAAMGQTGWQQLHEPIGAWANAPEGSSERQIYDEALRLIQASRPDEEATAGGATQALFPYAVQAALQIRIQPTAKEPVNTAAGWLARVRGGLRSTWNKLATDKGDFNSMNLVDLAFALAQQENPEHRPELDAVAQELADETAQLLSSISGAEDLFSLPRSRKDTVADIAAEHSPAIEVLKTDLAGETKYTLFLPDGTVATITSRDPTPHEVFGMDDASGQYITERPGEKSPPVGARSDVWVDVSRLEQGKWGGVIYNIAATFAHNTGRIFIGDPSGLKDIALRRRSEQMLASALKFGTTDHLAPHPRQVAGDARLGVPPLHWVYGDSVGNIQRLIDVNLAALDNALPDARNLTYDLDTGHFIDARTGDRLSKEALARSADASRAEGAVSASSAGWRTVARGAVLRALLGRWDQGSEGTSKGAGGERRGGRSEGVDGVGRQSDQPASPRNGEFQRGRSTLAGIAEQRDRLGSERPFQRIFYSRDRRSSEVAQ
ncbi:hypothetical protein [Acidovorax sp. A1169]|uniref:LPD3 domain-containing protein n=1 Tax=Acidovorax sp. A1169 TaxID=3059524 RepID=UPI002737F2B0|nr:hypothetical protein [Acidovorax sp. A1169]MDP4076849.1 hypothetical protein [Acidovorax sp. A1169]